MTKRASDFLIASVLIIVTLPVLFVAALGSALVLRAWPFFTQDRVGLNGQAFKFLKIRTLPLATPAYIMKGRLLKDRIPPFTRLLRNLHLDELPQLLLVLTGKMSLVGPRPEMHQFHDLLDPGFAAERLTMRPGCTGLWQISEAHDAMIGDAPEYDRYYLEHRTLRLDVWILVQTVKQMVGRTPQVSLDDVPSWTAPKAGAAPSVARTSATPPAPELGLAADSTDALTG